MSKYKILIADDHAMVRDGVKNLISKNEELEVIGEAENGKHAIELFEALKPDLIILDISMPVLNGMEVAREILSKSPSANIIMLSMYDDGDYISRCIECGVKGYVIKNESGSELELAIKTVLLGNNYFSRHVQDVIVKKYTETVSKRKPKDEAIKLTQREIEIIKLIADALTTQQMADKLFISPRTVETHRANLMKKLAVKNAVELIRKAQSLELI
jgi:DNA-binding NarL/FixJ family response regulator